MVQKCLPLYAFLIFFQCGNNDTSVATFVATLVTTLDTTEIEEGSENNGYEGLKMIRESS
jgi:hypothetical protein